jgi:hypothetical protein
VLDAEVTFRESISCQAKVGWPPRGSAGRGISLAELLKTAERVSRLKRKEICSGSKRRETVAMKEAVIVLGRRSGIGEQGASSGAGHGPVGGNEADGSSRI